jgi:two-component system chemotaxis response regulator CheB
LPAALFVVCHFPPEACSHLPEILSRQGPLLARHARHGEPIYPGQIYVAPPDYHVVLEPGFVQLNHGPRENHFRPSIDTLFRSAAQTHGPRVVAVILSGTLSDGVAGLLAVRATGGLSVVQDPRDALLPDLPQNASAIAGADHVVPAGEMGKFLAELVHQNADAGETPGRTDPVERVRESLLQGVSEGSTIEEERR